MKKVACYIRVSTENQLENYSIEEQTERLRAYCKAKDYVIYKIYTDGGYSGGNTNRPALQAMLSDIDARVFDTVLVYKLDRLSRSQKDTLTLIEDNFLAKNIDFVSMNENFDTSTPFGRATIGMLSVFAQLEKDQITERFTMGRIGRCKAGYFHGGSTIPKGYKYIDGQLIVDPAEAAIIRRAFEEFAAGKSATGIVKAHPGMWASSSSLIYTLRNALYIGKVKFGGQEYDGIHEPIISEELFHRVNKYIVSEERENAKTTAQKTPFRAGYMLSSLVYCKRCGARYSANHGYYKCYSRAKSSPKFVTDPNCYNDNWIIADLDNAVIAQVVQLESSDMLRKMLKKPKQKKIDVSAEIAKLDAQIDKLLELYQISEIPVDKIRGKIEDLNAKKEEFMHLEYTATNAVDNTVEFENNLKNFVKTSDTATTEQKRLMLSTIIERVEIDGSTISIKWRV